MNTALSHRRSARARATSATDGTVSSGSFALAAGGRIVEPGDGDLIQPSVNIRGGNEVTHGRLERLVSHPVLHRPHIEAGAQHSRGVRRAERLQIEFDRVQSGGLGDGFGAIERVLFAIAGRNSAE